MAFDDRTKLDRVVGQTLDDETRERPAPHLFATVTAIGAGVVTLDLYGTPSAGHHYDTSYTPTIGDQVYCTPGYDVFVLGKIS